MLTILESSAVCLAACGLSLEARCITVLLWGTNREMLLELYLSQCCRLQLRQIHQRLMLLAWAVSD